MKLKKSQTNDASELININGIENKEISNRIKWIEHNNNPILFLDYSNFIDTDDTINTIKEAMKYINQLKYDEIFLLVDVRNSFADEKIIIEALKQNAKILKSITKKSAVVGVTSSQEFILTIVNMFSGLGLKSFDTLEEAKDWLIN